jgi:hypothetical protein
MDFERVLERVLFLMPLWFGIGFIAPLTSEILHSLALRPLGMPPLAFGLMLGLVWGGYASWRRRWL